MLDDTGRPILYHVDRLPDMDAGTGRFDMPGLQGQHFPRPHIHFFTRTIFLQSSSKLLKKTEKFRKKSKEGLALRTGMRYNAISGFMARVIIIEKGGKP